MILTTARAKINLHLHITGRTDNGYHLLDSLVAFTDLTDTIEIKKADNYALSIIGDFQDNLSSSTKTSENLITQAAMALAKHYNIAPDVEMTLTKSIPLGGGLGGGSADAAATLIALCDFWGIPRDNAILHHLASNLGSDIAACLSKKPVILRDTGNTLLPAPHVPESNILLVNPNTHSPTPLVYKTYKDIGAAFSNPVSFPEEFHSTNDICDFLNKNTRNDLTDAAMMVNPDIKRIMTCLNTMDNALLIRLSGSGSTCFAIFKDKHSTTIAHDTIKKQSPDWWVRATSIQ